jgi:hypothetical protein
MSRPIRFEVTPLLKVDAVTMAISESDHMFVSIPVCGDPADPLTATATLYNRAAPDRPVHTEAMVLLTDPLHGRLVYVLADEQMRYRPAAAVEGTINAFVNAFVNAIIRRA